MRPLSPGPSPAGASIEVKDYQAASYTNAMHELCIGCHTKKAAEKKNAGDDSLRLVPQRKPRSD